MSGYDDNAPLLGQLVKRMSTLSMGGYKVQDVFADSSAGAKAQRDVLLEEWMNFLSPNPPPNTSAVKSEAAAMAARARNAVASMGASAPREAVMTYFLSTFVQSAASAFRSFTKEDRVPLKTRIEERAVYLNKGESCPTNFEACNIQSLARMGVACPSTKSLGNDPWFIDPSGNVCMPKSSSRSTESGLTLKERIALVSQQNVDLMAKDRKLWQVAKDEALEPTLVSGINIVSFEEDDVETANLVNEDALADALRTPKDDKAARESNYKAVSEFATSSAADKYLSFYNNPVKGSSAGAPAAGSLEVARDRMATHIKNSLVMAAYILESNSLAQLGQLLQVARERSVPFSIVWTLFFYQSKSAFTQAAASQDIVDFVHDKTVASSAPQGLTLDDVKTKLATAAVKAAPWNLPCYSDAIEASPAVPAGGDGGLGGGPSGPTGVSGVSGASAGDRVASSRGDAKTGVKSRFGVRRDGS